MGSVLLGVAVLSFTAAVIMAAAGRHADHPGSPADRRLGSLLITVGAVALVAATARLVWAIARLDFGFVYVGEQARARSSGGYRLAALWGGAEGSLVFFATLVAVMVAWATLRHRARRWGVAVAAAILATMAGTALAAANPFERSVLPPVRGAGLTPILEHPAMLYHPPILYAGLAATAAPFTVAIGATGSPGSVDRATIRHWTLIAWTLLTIGLATGANWAYVELGWGGYWAWDPVENTALMVWLVLTAALHVQSRPAAVEALPRTAILLATSPFTLAMFGSAVTRSGGLSSVHAFADSTAIGFGLGFAVVIAAVAVGWRSWRLRLAVGSAGARRDSLHRSRLAFIAVIALAVFMTVAVLMGVGLPLLPGSDRIVPAEFYNRVGAPVLVVALLALVVSESPPSSGGAERSGRRSFVPLSLGPLALALRFLAPLVAGVVAAVAAAAAALAGMRDMFSLIIVALGAAVVVGSLRSAVGKWVRRRRLSVAPLLGHVGFVILALGIAGSAQSSVTSVVLAPGDLQEFGTDLTMRYESFTVTDGPRPGSEASVVTAVVADSAGHFVALAPGLVSHPDRAVVLAETSLDSTLRRDVQVVVRAITDDGLATFDLAERPFQQLVWWGSALIALAGTVALAEHRPSTIPSTQIRSVTRDNRGLRS